MTSEPDRESHWRVEIAPLQFADLDRVEAIEKECYGMPWSRAMFAGELIKSSSICLGALRLERLIGYLIVSLYVDDWHIMNLASIWPGAAARGRAAVGEFFRAQRGWPRARLHARGATIERCCD